MLHQLACIDWDVMSFVVLNELLFRRYHVKSCLIGNSFQLLLDNYCLSSIESATNLLQFSDPIHPHLFTSWGLIGLCLQCSLERLLGPRQANLVLIAYASSEGSGEPAHPRSLARTSAARSYKQWVKRTPQTESQIPSPSEWLGMRS